MLTSRPPTASGSPNCAPKRDALEAAERTRERKRRTRRLILIGSLFEKDRADPNPPIQERLDRALEKPQDRALFDLPPR